MDNVLFASATEIALAIRRHEVSSVEVTRAYLEQIKRHNPALNAIVTLDAEGALAQARNADEWMARGDTCFELHGVPITLKDCHATEGMRTTAGYQPLADYVPDADGTVAFRVRYAGAIIMGKTNVSTLLSDAQSFNEIFGRTNNPWNLDRMPGGSSGGAGAAVASGMTALEFGSDIGGSIRIPSHACGIFGFKPTAHRVSNVGHIPDLPNKPRTTRVMNCIGPMARSIDDLIMGFRIIAGPDGRDVDVPPVPVRDVGSYSIHYQRIAWASSFPGLPIQSDTRAAIEGLGGTLAGMGMRIQEALPEVDFEEQLHVREVLRKVGRLYVDEFEGSPPSAEDYLRALDRRDHFIRVWEAFFDNWDALICPVMMTTAFPHCERGTPVLVDGVPHDYATVADYCRPFNLTGHPAVTIPIGFDAEGLPIGVQLVGKRWNDEELLGIAQVLVREVTQPFQRPPGY